MRSTQETTWNGTLKWLGRHLTQGFLLWEFQWCISWSHLTHFGAYCKTYVHSGAFMSHFHILWYEWRFKRHYISAFYSTIFGEKDTPRKFMMGRYQKWWLQSMSDQKMILWPSSFQVPRCAVSEESPRFQFATNQDGDCTTKNSIS